MATNLTSVIREFDTEEKCIAFLVRQRWGGVPTCPYCGSQKSYNIEGGKRFKCGNNECYKKYSVTVGSIFHASNIPLQTWFAAIYLLTAHKKGISSIQLGKDLGVTQKTSWFMLHRIRENMRDKSSNMLGNTVEIDEVYVGGKVGNMSKAKRTKLRLENNTYNTKTMVMGMLERDGNLKLITTAPANVLTMQKAVRENVDCNANVITDSHAGYYNLSREHKSHETVCHSAFEYVREGNIHTNSIEGAFSLLKRSIIGIYHQVSPKHLSRYCDETAYRYNRRDMKDADRFNLTLSNVEGRLTYRDLVNTPKPETGTSLIGQKSERMGAIAIGAKKPVVQLFDGVIVGRYDSLTQAAEMTGINMRQISKVLNGYNATAKGYQFIFANLAD